MSKLIYIYVEMREKFLFVHPRHGRTRPYITPYLGSLWTITHVSSLVLASAEKGFKGGLSGGRSFDPKLPWHPHVLNRVLKGRY